MMLNEYQVFERTVRHLFTMEGPALCDTSCAYRGAGGSRCLVGYWIPDANYTSSLEGAGLAALFADSYTERDNLKAESVFDALPREVKPHVRLLWSLQEIHDGAERDDNLKWASKREIVQRLKDVADKYGFLIPPEFLIEMEAWADA